MSERGAAGTGRRQNGCVHGELVVTLKSVLQFSGLSCGDYQLAMHRSWGVGGCRTGLPTDL